MQFHAHVCGCWSQDALGISFIHHKSEWQQIVKLLKEKQVKFRATARAATRQVLLEALVSLWLTGLMCGLMHS